MTQLLEQPQQSSLPQPMSVEVPPSSHVPGRVEEDYLDWLENHSRAQPRRSHRTVSALIGIACGLTVVTAVLLAWVGYVW